MIIRRATREDLAAIAAIQSTSPGAAIWDPQSYLNHDCYLAEVEGCVAGFLVSRPTSAGEREILNLAVEPGRRRRGIARGLLEHEFASSSGSWFLEVRESNAAALGLYRALGFRMAGSRKNYYSNPLETAIVLKKDS